MKLPRVYPILDTETLAARNIALEMAAAAFLEGGAQILQIRHKGHWSRAVFEASRQVARLCREAGVQFIVNDRADIAMLLEAGLHVGQDDLSARDSRHFVGTDAVIGFSTHNAAQLSTAGGEPVDYIALGPIFQTSTKQNPDPVVGVDELSRCRGLTEKPLVAIGGITCDNAQKVWNAGADSVAVVGALLPPQPGARSLRERMEDWQRLAY